MSSVLFAGGRLDSVTISGTATEVTTAGSFDSTYCDASLNVTTVSSILATFRDTSSAATDLTTGQTGYLHCEVYFNTANFSSANTIISYEDSSGFPWLALRCTGTTNTVGLYYNSGTGASPVWTQVGSGVFLVVLSTRYVIDIKVTIGSPHSAELSINNSLISSGTFTQASFTTARGGRFANAGTGTPQTFYSQIMATEGRSTINGKVKYSRATGAGTNSGWTGAFGNVNEAVNSDATIDSTTTAAVRQTYAMGDVTVPAGYAIVSVFHALRAKNDGTAPANIKSSIRSGTTNYDAASNLTGIGTSFGPLIQRYDTDPNTSSSWTQTTWNAAEAGYLSAT
jgi:hypothetical protein